MAFEMPVDPREERRARYLRWATAALGLLLLGLVAYLAYAGFQGSAELVNPEAARTCRLPSAYGWSYEAVNYDLGSDASLAAEADPDACATDGQPAGTALVAKDGTQLAGWYIPAGSGAGPEAPTVIVVHGHGSNKNQVLPWAELLHQDYNLVLFDLRNSGQSAGTKTTFGVQERWDLEAVFQWLDDTKAPAEVAVLGIGTGGIAATSAVASGLPVQGLILDSVAASVAGIAERVAARDELPLSVPASWAMMLGALFRTGVDITAADPVLTIDDVGSVPVLVLQGGADTLTDPTSGDQLVAAAARHGITLELHVCPDAADAQLLETCPDDYRSWVLGFLARSLTP
jgi:uncharacterized protein